MFCELGGQGLVVLATDAACLGRPACAGIDGGSMMPKTIVTPISCTGIGSEDQVRVGPAGLTA